MKPIVYSDKSTSKLNQQELQKKIAFHQAGHAVAICRRHQQENLPPVFFQIVINPLNDKQFPELPHQPYAQHFAYIEGGRLIENLPVSFASATQGFSNEQKFAYQCALEADIVSILAGPLAEAKYIAVRDGEMITPHLVNLAALQYYGGLADLHIAQQYLQCFPEKDGFRERKANELFLSAFYFINQLTNWRAIVATAQYILNTCKTTITCEEILQILDIQDHVSFIELLSGNIKLSDYSKT